MYIMGKFLNNTTKHKKKKEKQEKQQAKRIGSVITCYI